MSKNTRDTIIAIVVIAIFVGLWAISTSDSGGSSGHYGSDGYYKPSKSEMDDVWDDVNDWMDDNW